MTQTTLLPAVLCLCFAASHAQQPADATPKLSPQGAYEQASRPLDIIRRAPQNWSEIELAALKTATAQAKTACLASSPQDYAGDDLIAYARLCAFGQTWQPVEFAAYKYIQAKQLAPIKPQDMRTLATAYDYEIQASLRLQKPAAAFQASRVMLATVPYDDLTSEAINSTVNYLQLSDTGEALALLAQRQPILLSMLRSRSAPGAPDPPLFPLRALFAEAIALPSMQQFANQPDAAAASIAEIEQALPATLPPDDAISIAESRRRYRLLGSHLPPIATFSWLLDSSGAGIPPALNSPFGAATVLLSFPDWCNQCVALHTAFFPAWKRLRDQSVRFFALLAQPEPPPKPAPKEIPKTAGKAATADSRPAPFPGEKPGIPHNDLQLDVKPTAAALLAGTPTFAVPTQTLDQFSAADFPLIIVADHDGIIRALQLADDSVLVPGGQIDQLADHVTRLWPPPKP